MTNGRSIQQSAFSAAGDRMVFCPKPRRLFHFGALFTEQSDPVPVLRGSPPARSVNPMVHDARFGKAVPLGSVFGCGSGSGSGSSPGRNVCTRIQYGLSPSTVRIEGFERSRSRGVAAVA